MASKSQGRELRKATMTLKEKRAAKREKLSTETVIRRKKLSR